MEQADVMYNQVSATPVKSFFVSMLTRDLQLEEAILDLLDNCVDGIRRSRELEGDKPYDGNWAEIKFDQDSFEISDNCGGISWSLATYAFRLGRDPQREPDSPGVVGVYGIGMKRAIFKMGKSCLISTQSGEDRYDVEITPSWIEDEDDWDIPVNRSVSPMSEDGTTIVVRGLHEGISSLFGAEADYFQTVLMGLITSHYSFIINRGFRVAVNGRDVSPRSRGLIFAEHQQASNEAIQPFIYKATTDEGVEVFMAVGFTGPIPSQEEAINEQDELSHSTEEAGWTIICNDRAVLFCDKTELTGWGDTPVPRYHTQFIAISGIVEFRCDDPSKLPMTTTKRGVDASSTVYLQVKTKMREGMKLFTDYTNRWKGRAEESRFQVDAGIPLTFQISTKD